MRVSPVAVLVSLFALPVSAAPAWTPQAQQCVAEYEKHYPTMGSWIYQAAACTARAYPPTSSKTHEQIQACANRVFQETYHLCQLCGPDRIDAVMTYLLTTHGNECR